jgi:excisionase family DNA binding protein
MAIGGSSRLLPVPEAAEYLSVAERTLRENFRRWGIPAHKVGRALWFSGARRRDLSRSQSDRVMADV